MALTNFLTKKNIEWLVGLFRKKTYVRVTWFVLFTGAAFLATPIWEPIVTTLTGRLLGLEFEAPDSPAIGAVILALGLGFYAFAARQELALEHRQRRALREHDRALAARFRELTPENAVDSYVSSLYNADGCYGSQIHPIDQGRSFLISDEAHFLIDEVKTVVNDYITATDALGRFISYKFFVSDMSPSDDPWFVMTPALNVDRGGEWSSENSTRYTALQKELSELCLAYRDAYSALIQTFHRYVNVD